MTSTSHNTNTYKLPETNLGTETSWIPLVTPYSTNGQECTSSFWLYQGTLFTWDPAFRRSIDPHYSCVPEAAISWWNQWAMGGNSETVLSIGPIICPEPYTQVSTVSVDASHTRVLCCPIEVGSGTVLSYQSVNSCSELGSTTLTTNETATVFAIQINGWTFGQEVDDADSTPTPNTTSCSSDCNGALDTGDKVGIGIGVGMGVIGLATMVAGLLMMRRARKARGTPQTAPERLTQAHS
ncbi:hypothetical protein LA080_015139 [Diaporthe eres]|nr:hypothetical protein LA080_015139 [Diaporthe eres]